MAKAKKDFSTINTGNIYNSTIAQATQEKRKERKTYTEQEAADMLENMQSAGHKGVKLPRINLAFTPSNYEYLRTMAHAAGISYTEFVNRIIAQHKSEHEETYQKAIEFREGIF